MIVSSDFSFVSSVMTLAFSLHPLRKVCHISADRKALPACSAILYPSVVLSKGLILRLGGTNPSTRDLILKMKELLHPDCVLLFSAGSSCALALISGCHFHSAHVDTNVVEVCQLTGAY